MREVVLDFETRNPGIDLKEVGAWRYAEDYGTSILCAAFHDDRGMQVWTDRPEHVIAWDNLRDLALDPDTIFIAFNAAFEKAIWRHIMVPTYFFPDIPDNRWHDIQAVCAMKMLPLNLEDACDATGLEIAKDMDGRKYTLSLSRMGKTGYLDNSDRALQRVISYCCGDVRAEMALHKRVGWLPASERDVWLLDQQINQRGVGLDLPFVAAAQHVVGATIPALAKEFQAITGGLNPTQVARFLAWLKERQVLLPNLQKETVENYLENLQNIGRIDTDSSAGANRALSIRRLIGSSSIKKLGRMSECVGSDGRVRGLYQYHGAGPGRWSGRLVQPQNLPRGSVQLRDVTPAEKANILVNSILTRDPDYVELVSGRPPVETVLSSLRHSFIAGRNRLFVVGDFATIEACIVLALAGQRDKVELMRRRGPVYEDMAQSIFGHPVNKVDHPEERQTGKNTVLGCGFQMGADKFQMRYAKDKPIEWCEKVINAYRRDWAPSVPPLWWAMDTSLAKCLRDGGLPTQVYSDRTKRLYPIVFASDGEFMTMQLPSGRKLWYHKPVFQDWVGEKKYEIGYSRYDNGPYNIRTYGGMLTENAVQGMARDLLTHAMLSLSRWGYEIVMHTHDEIVIEVPEADADEGILIHHMTKNLPEWAIDLGIPIAVDCWIGDRYRK